MRKQAEASALNFCWPRSPLELSGDIKTVRTGRGDLRCFGVLLATGAHPRMVGFQGEEQFRGRGVAYCATCDGEFFTDKDVFVVGGGFAAAEESVFLTKYARHVTILIRGDGFTCAQATADAARNHEKITVLTNTVVEEVSGDTALRFIRYRNTRTGQVTKHHAADGETFGVFVFAGYEPATELVQGWRSWTSRAMSSPTAARRPRRTACMPPGTYVSSPCGRWSPLWETRPGRHGAGAAVRRHAGQDWPPPPATSEPGRGSGGTAEAGSTLFNGICSLSSTRCSPGWHRH